jgi:hypothetical protein
MNSKFKFFHGGDGEITQDLNARRSRDIYRDGWDSRASGHVLNDNPWTINDLHYRQLWESGWSDRDGWLNYYG